jgi:hypothetical protein
MALNNDPNFPPSGPAPYFINREWCIGDSLTILNNNANNFDTRLELLSTQAISLVFVTPSTTPYTVAPLDSGKTVLTNFTTANTINLPNNLPVGYQISVLQIGVGQTSFAATGTGNNLRHPDNFTKIYKQWSMATAIYVSNNNWVLVGDLIS